MKPYYDKIIITNLPAFYKIRLFNEISRYQSLLVIYTGHGSDGRNVDFYNESILFKSIKLSGSSLNKCLEIFKLIRKVQFKEMLIGSWDHPAMWVTILSSPKSKNSLIVESSVFESSTSGLKGLIKRIFCSRISTAYVSGVAQQQLMEHLSFKGKYKVTHGVGIFNYHDQPEYSEKQDAVKKFLFVGRLIDVKNLIMLVKVFNNLPDLELNIVGFGEQEDLLRSIAGPNVKFHGAIENKKIYSVYQQMDVFILPSKSEPWGLVVEEALNNGLPVIVSDRVGCRYDLITEEHGLVFNYNDSSSLIQAINKMQDLTYYNTLCKNISNLNFTEIEKKQVETYLG